MTHQPDIVQENPDKSFGEISRIVSDRWKALGSEEKQQYEDMAKEDKQRYKDEMANYDGPTTVSASRKKGEDKGKRKRAEKDPNAPKRAMPAFMAYSNEQRKVLKQEQPDLHVTDVLRVLGQRWKALSPEEKEVRLFATITSAFGYWALTLSLSIFLLVP